jgi:hypothetical protein
MSKNTPSILKTTEGVPVIPNLDDLVENMDYINVSKQGADIGKMLSIDAPFKETSTLLGDITNLNVYSRYVTTDTFPNSLLSKSKLSKTDYLSLSNKRVTVPNYWSIMVHAIWERIVNDAVVLEWMIALPKDIIFTSFVYKTSTYKGDVIKTISYNPKMGRYLSVLRQIKIIIDDPNFNLDTSEYMMVALMKASKDKPEFKVFDKLPFNITVPDKYNV